MLVPQGSAVASPRDNHVLLSLATTGAAEDTIHHDNGAMLLVVKTPNDDLGSKASAMRTLVASVTA